MTEQEFIRKLKEEEELKMGSELCEYQIDKKVFKVRFDEEGNLTVGNVILDKSAFNVLMNNEDQLTIEARIPSECPRLMANGPHGMPACCENGEDKPRTLGEQAPLPLECIACQRGW